MVESNGIEQVVARFREGRRPIRIVALGSSNTERGHAIGNAQNWVDWLDTGLKRFYGRLHITINAGISGDTSGDALARFDSDVALFRPHLVLITLGGNDANPERSVTQDAFRSNLFDLVERARAIGESVPVLQTYYSCDGETMAAAGKAEYVRRFHACMEIVREAARESGAGLIDHLRRWEPLRRDDPAAYRSLMHDPLHMNAAGQMLFALDVLRALGARPVQDLLVICADAIRLQERLDAAESERSVKT